VVGGAGSPGKGGGSVPHTEDGFRLGPHGYHLEEPGTSGEESPGLGASSRSNSPRLSSVMGSSPNLERSLLKHHAAQEGGRGEEEGEERQNLLPGWQHSTRDLPDLPVSIGESFCPTPPFSPITHGGCLVSSVWVR
jgi:hypothetical protein